MIWTSSTILNCKYCSWTHWATLIFRWWFQGLNKPILSPSKPITMKIWKYAKILSEQTTSNPCSRSRRTMSSSTQRKRRSRPRPSPRSKTEICSTMPSSDSSSKRKCCSNWWASSRTSSTFVPILHLSKDNTIWHFTQSIGCSTILWCHLRSKSKPRRTNLKRWTCLSKIRISTSRLSSDLRSPKMMQMKKARRMDPASQRERRATIPSSPRQLLEQMTIGQQEKAASTMLPQQEAT